MPVKRAVALRYQREKELAPRVVAKGSGAVAEAILKIANEGSVEVVEDEALIQSLMALEVDDVIPEELYKVVAEVLSFVYRKHGK